LLPNSQTDGDLHRRTIQCGGGVKSRISPKSRFQSAKRRPATKSQSGCKFAEDSEEPRFGKAWSRAAANSIPPPNPKARAMRQHFVVRSIRDREVARAQRSGIRHCEDALQPHSISVMGANFVVTQSSEWCFHRFILALSRHSGLM
jgi:hypothetical protein